MPCRYRAVVVAGLALTLSLAPADPTAAVGGDGALRAPSSDVPGSELPVVRAHGYRMAGRVRPLLFWIGRDDVGLARIVWRRDDGGGLGYELLVGTDPARAPRAINRWGYVAEERVGRDGLLLALMSRSDEASYTEAEAGVSRPGSSGEFKAIRGRVSGGAATSRVFGLQTATRPTIHELAWVLDRVRAMPLEPAGRETSLGPDVRPGFLAAVAELVDRSVEAARAPGAPAGRVVGSVVPYVFGRSQYEVRVKSLQPAEPAPGAGTAARPVHAVFEIRTIATGARTRFEMTYGTAGDLAGVPLTIAWRPRWWLEVELRLDEHGSPGDVTPAVNVATARRPPS